MPSIKSVMEARVVTGYHQKAASTIDTAAPVPGTGGIWHDRCFNSTVQDLVVFFADPGGRDVR